MSHLSQPTTDWISYIFLGISFLILCNVLWILHKSKKLLSTELKIVDNRIIGERKTRPVAIGYENWHKDIGT
jgi:hypothetical protein